MTTTEPGGASWRDWSEWWAHRTPWVVVVLFFFGISTLLLGWPSVVWTVVLMFSTVALVINMGVHEASMCSRCLANTPSNPQRALRRKGWALWLHHHRYVVYLAWFAAWAFQDRVPKTVGGLFVIGIFLALVLLTTVDLLHRPLQPWCPRCPKWGGGDDGPEERTPTPLPQPSGVKQG